MKKLGYSLLAGGTALLALTFLVLFVITLLPVGLDGVRVQEPVRVSASALDADGTKYLLQVRGSLINENDTPVVLDAITLRIKNGEHTKTVTLDGVTLQTRLALDLTDSWEDTVAYDRVDALSVTVDGREVRMENREESVIGTDSVFTLALAALAALVCLGAAKQRYYLYQEERMK